MNMKNLHVRGIPDDLYQRLQQFARTSNRSVNAQVVQILSEALADEKLYFEQAFMLASIYRRRFVPPANSPTSLDLLHEDRNR
jgi:plasmid stability protein